MDIIECKPEFKRTVEDICLATGSEHARTDAAHGSFAKLMYCDGYIDRGICYLLTTDGRTPVGYVACAPSFTEWESWFQPYLEQICSLSDAYGKRAENEIAMYRAYAEKYPAHLHINILPGYTGGGNGTRLMGRLMERLRSDGVPGVMLGVSASNGGAIRFYRRNGFDRIGGDERTLIMGRQLFEDSVRDSSKSTCAEQGQSA